jgi:hypothetical protein
LDYEHDVSQFCGALEKVSRWSDIGAASIKTNIRSSNDEAVIRMGDRISQPILYCPRNITLIPATTTDGRA